jgi:hypothetical protein
LARDVDDDQADNVQVDPVPDVTGQGKPHTATAHAGGVTLRGKTNARFDGGSFHTENISTQAGSGCTRCKAKDCVHVTGQVVTTYKVTTQVSLPNMAQFRNLTPCQRQAVQDAIQNRLAPHEQDHVTAFSQYNGTSSQDIDVTTCRTAFPNTVQQLVNSEERARRAQAQAASDALDPFQIDVDLDCTDD